MRILPFIIITTFLFCNFISHESESQKSIYINKMEKPDYRTIKRYKYKASHKVDPVEKVFFEKGNTKNIILMIGDGMGLSQINAALIANKNKLYLESFPVTGFVKTHSADNLITDSAAGATAMATGKKINNGTVAIDPDNQKLKTFLEIAEDKNLSTGIVVTSAITHATPAAFASHAFSRHYYEQIATEFARKDIEVLIGGGRCHFTDRLDKVNLLNTFREKNYSVIDTITALDNASGDKIAGILYENNPPTIMEGRDDMLLRSTKKALAVLTRNDNGFFLLIEGSQIDWGNHQHNVLYQTEELLDFDIVIGEILKFAAADKETLVIVTSDHETGGMAIAGGNLRKGIVHVDYTTYGHTGGMVPIFAFGPSAELFQGMMDNTDIFFKMMKAMKWEAPEQ